jgi:hypothetical protein
LVQCMLGLPACQEEGAQCDSNLRSDPPD